MCGIAGFLNRTGAGPDALARVTAMTRTLAHRGPDHEGTWADHSAGIALGHRRLAVVDLSPAGNQPMESVTGRYVIVFNGEIYNSLDLRKELDSAFQGHSDTEVMLACFEEWGVLKSVQRFNGMFAFAVWDRLERTLYLARDRLGEKPLYHGWAGGTLLFGSELKALRAHPDFPGAIDRSVLALYMKCGYVPAPYSIYHNVFKLCPGTLLIVKDGSRPETCSYWSFKDVVKLSRADPFQGSAEEAVRQLEALLTDAVRLRMVADVPLGAFLSGGIDSSLVVALMQTVSHQPVKTFTIGFHETSYNEAAIAKEVARHLHTDHTEWYVTPADALAVVPALPSLYDEPFADSSQIPTCLVSQLARKHVTVSLSGDGGDELFGGYSRYARISRLRRRISAVPASMWCLASQVIKIITRRSQRTVWPDTYRLQKLAVLAPLRDPAAFYDAYCWLWHDSAMLVREAHKPSTHALHDDWPRCENFIHQMMAADTVTYLPDDILVKMDRASMGVSLESRIPLLDPRVVEFAWRLPIRLKIHDGHTKWILRQILYKHVPHALLERPKSGFAIPLGEWIRGPLRGWAEELLDKKRIDGEGHLDSTPIRRRWREHLSCTHDHSGPLWSVLMFQAWLENQAQAEARVCSPNDFGRSSVANFTR